MPSTSSACIVRRTFMTVLSFKKRDHNPNDPKVNDHTVSGTSTHPVAVLSCYRLVLVVRGAHRTTRPFLHGLEVPLCARFDEIRIAQALYICARVAQIQISLQPNA